MGQGGKLHRAGSVGGVGGVGDHHTEPREGAAGDLAGLHAPRDSTKPLPSWPPSGPGVMERNGGGLGRLLLQESWEEEKPEIETGRTSSGARPWELGSLAQGC